jgi:hypothetical protein
LRYDNTVNKAEHFPFWQNEAKFVRYFNARVKYRNLDRSAGKASDTHALVQPAESVWYPRSPLWDGSRRLLNAYNLPQNALVQEICITPTRQKY